MARDPLRFFRIEAQEVVTALERGLLDLSRGVAPSEVLPDLRRHAHSLKGAAAVVQVDAAVGPSHALEDLLIAMAEADGPADEGQVEELRAGIAELKETLEVALSADAGAPEPPQPVAPSPALDPTPAEARVSPSVTEVVRVESELLERLGASLTRLGISLTSLGALGERHADVLRKLRGLRERMEASESGQGAEECGALADTLEALLDLQGDRLARALWAHRDCVEGATTARLQPANDLLHDLEMATRETAQRVGREVRFEGIGGAIRCEAQALSTLRPALMHAVRNAVIHGIEAPEDRRRVGKVSEGLVEVSVERRGHLLRWVVRDDGRGPDLEALAAAAAERGTGQSLSPEEAAFLPGVTTRAVADHDAGRGVGLDVVRVAAEDLGGRARLAQAPDGGALVEVVVPASLTAFQILVVRVGDRRVALPFAAVQAVRHLGDETPRSEGGTPTLTHEGRLLPLGRLHSLLASNSSSEQEPARVAVLIGVGRHALALLVDEVLAIQDTVLEPLPPGAGSQPLVTGAYLDEDGSPVLILAPGALAQMLQAGGEALGLGAGPTSRRVLVVDDSLTTRMLQQAVLEGAGYQVDMAPCAEDGLDRLAENAYDALLVDVEMPGMNGFEMVSKLRGETRWSDLPIIMLSTLGSASDRRRGLDVGADGYMVKSEYDEARLLGMLEGLVRS